MYEAQVEWGGFRERRTDVSEMEVGVVVEAMKRLEIDVPAVRFVHHLKANHGFEVTDGAYNSLEHVEEGTLEELLYGHLCIGNLELRGECVASPEDGGHSGGSELLVATGPYAALILNVPTANDAAKEGCTRLL